MAGIEFDRQPQGESRRSPLQAHDGRISAKTQAIFADYKEQSAVERNGSRITVVKKDDELRAVLMNKNYSSDTIDYSEAVILRFFPHEEETPIELIRGRSDTKIALHYGGIDDEGNASFMDGGAVVYRRGNFGARSFYFPSTRKVKFDLGIDLFIDKTEDSFIVRDEDDSTVQGIAFPPGFNIYERLQHYEDLIRNGGHDGR